MENLVVSLQVDEGDLTAATLQVVSVGLFERRAGKDGVLAEGGNLTD